LHIYDQTRNGALALHAQARTWANQTAWRSALFEFVMFGIKQAWACLYGGTMLALLILTMLFWPKEGVMLSRFDFLFLAAIALQVLLVTLKLERLEEVKVIAIFHVVGTIMELFKTHMGSWTYPGDAFFKIGGVPLFTGFMYACVGSYIARITRLMDLRFSDYPPMWMTWVLAIGAYVNFFTHHFGPDIRIGLYVFSVLIFFKCRVYFTPDRKARWMPMLLGFFLVSLFIWFAENIGTFTNTWIYPHQKDGWHLVPLSKMGAWYLLMLLSFVLVTQVHPPQPPDPQTKTPDP
jgi:uncharacterized membrane protein YoaT (DUF817 family)